MIRAFQAVLEHDYNLVPSGANGVPITADIGSVNIDDGGTERLGAMPRIISIRVAPPTALHWAPDRPYAQP